MKSLRKSVLIFISAESFDEIEFTSVKSKLASKYQIFICSDATNFCRGSKGLFVQPDVKLFNVHPKNFEGIVLIGGKGIPAYFNNVLLKKITEEFNKLNKCVAAICGAPVILLNAGIIAGKNATVFEKYEKIFLQNGVNFTGTDVITDGNIITANSNFAAESFAEHIYNYLENK